MQTTKFITTILLSVQMSCAYSTETIKPELTTKSFDLITIGDSVSTTRFNQEFILLNTERKEQSFKSCNDVLVYNYQDINTSEQFNFKLISASCTAIYKFLEANPSTRSYFPKNITHDLILYFPANSSPIFSKQFFEESKNKTLSQAYTSPSINDSNNKTKLITDFGNIYLDIVARGDFNNDGFEDLLVSTQWYARNAYGKYNDLVILSKTTKDKSIEIIWRLNPVK